MARRSTLLILCQSDALKLHTPAGRGLAMLALVVERER